MDRCKALATGTVYNASSWHAGKGKSTAPPTTKDPRRRIELGGAFLPVDCGRKLLVEAAWDGSGSVAHCLVTHPHRDHVDECDTVAFGNRLRKGEAVLHWSAYTAAVVAGSSNGLGLRSLHSTATNQRQFVEPGSVFSVPGTNVDVYALDAGHTVGSLIFVAFDKGTGKIHLNSGDLRASADVCDNMRKLLQWLREQHPHLDVMVELAVVDDTSLIHATLPSSEGALEQLRNELAWHYNPLGAA